MQVSMRFGAALVLALSLFAAAPASADGGYVFVRNAKNHVAQVNNSTLRSLLASQTKQWPGGAPVTLVMPGESSGEMGWVASVYFSTNGRMLFNMILEKAPSSAAGRPVMARDTAEALSAVAKREGSIAIVKAGAPLPAGVAVLDITD